MSSIVVSGDMSGTVTLQAPATSGSTVLNLPAVSGTVVIGTTPSGTIVGTTDAQTLTNKTLTSPTITGASMSSMASSVLTSGTVQASTSGTSIDFTGIPSWAKRITVMFDSVSTNGSSVLLVQVGAGSVTASGYLGSAGVGVNTASSNVSNYTTGFGVFNNGAGAIVYGAVVLSLVNGNTWVASGTQGFNNVYIGVTGGRIALGGTLDRVRITTVNGTDTFDAGSINIMYE